MMKYLYFIFLLSYWHSSLTFAADDELKIAVFIEPPFVDLVDGELVGHHIEIANLIAASVELTPVFILCPFARCLNLVQQGQADMMLGLKKLPEREKDLIFLNPPYMVQHYPLRFYTLASKKVEINTFGDLQKLIVGTLRGASYFDLFDKNTAITKVELNTREQLVQMLLRGRIDTFMEREESILPLVSEQEYKTQFSLAHYQYDKAVNSYIAISKNTHIKNYAERLSTELQRFISNNTFEKIRMKSKDK